MPATPRPPGGWCGGGPPPGEKLLRDAPPPPDISALIPAYWRRLESICPETERQYKPCAARDPAQRSSPAHVTVQPLVFRGLVRRINFVFGSPCRQPFGYSFCSHCACNGCQCDRQPTRPGPSHCRACGTRSRLPPPRRMASARAGVGTRGARACWMMALPCASRLACLTRWAMPRAVGWTQRDWRLMPTCFPAAWPMPTSELLSPQGDGTYMVAFVPLRPGRYQLTLRLHYSLCAAFQARGCMQHIPGSMQRVSLHAARVAPCCVCSWLAVQSCPQACPLKSPAP